MTRTTPTQLDGARVIDADGLVLATLTRQPDGLFFGVADATGYPTRVDFTQGGEVRMSRAATGPVGKVPCDVIQFNRREVIVTDEIHLRAVFDTP